MYTMNTRHGVIDRTAAIPLYHQIFLQLRDEILSGLRPFGSLIPTEKELASTNSVSRITARRALDELAQNHFVSRKRRVGTTVIFRPAAKPIEANIDQAIESLLEFGRVTKVRVLTVCTEPAPPWIAEAMQIKPGEQVVRAERVRDLDGTPLSYVLSYVPEVLSRHVTRSGLSKSPILKLITKAGYRLGKGTQTIAAVLADPFICRTLGVEPRSAILRVTRAVCDETGKPILLTIVHYRSDRYQLRIELQH